MNGTHFAKSRENLLVVNYSTLADYIKRYSMRITKILSAVVFVSLLISLTAFTPKPPILHEKVSPLSQTFTRFPFSHELSAGEYRSKIQDNIHATNDYSFEQSQPLIRIEANSVNLLTNNGNTELNPLKNLTTKALPTGVSQKDNLFRLDFINNFIEERSPKNSLGYFSTTHSSAPTNFMLSSNYSYVSGPICLPFIPYEDIVNPFFIQYRELPIDPQLQATPLYQRSKKYIEIARQTARKYRLSPSLILAVMHVESGFNPNAVSNRDAHGLMQIVLSTAGAEVHNYLKKDMPLSPDMLHDPATNILYGTTYLHLLNSRHFNKIHNPLSREYCMIAAYNGGSSRVLKLFGVGEQAFDTINSLPPAEVYRKIQLFFPSPETRRFITKVVGAKNAYYAHNG